MKNKIKNKKIFRRLTGLLFLTTLVYGGCSMDDGDETIFSELGTKQSEYILPETEGSIEIEVLTDQPILKLKLEDPDIDWLSLPIEVTDLNDGVMKFNVDFLENTRFPRMAEISVLAPNVDRFDTIYIKQKGKILPTMEFRKSSQQISGKASDVLAEIDTNLGIDEIQIDISYTGSHSGEEWINNDFEILNNEYLKFSYLSNPSETALRTAKITLSYIDGWGEKIVSELFLTQANANEQFGENISFPDLRLKTGEVVTEYLFIEGHIVSDAGNMNVGDTPNTTPTAIDYSQNDKTAYIQSLDGVYGFRLLAKTADDNIFRRYSKVQLLVKGANIEFEDNPDRYTIRGITSDMVLSAETGTVTDLVKKEKHVKDLKDDDIYTQVTLKDLEFPIRKGSLTPINEGYATSFNAHRIAKYPQLMRDINGNSIYLLTNMKCPYRRDGSTLPYGSGKVTGVIVHETFARFNYEDTDNEDTFGNIGRYQIRHLAKDDIDLKEEQGDGFSQFLAEYRYFKVDNGIVLPTRGNGRLRASVPDAEIVGTADYSYLGPIGASNTGNQQGNGVITEEGAQLSTSLNTNSDGKGSVDASDNSSWQYRSRNWWNYDKNRGEAWIVEFSTQGITKQLSLQLSTMNWQSNGAPRYWNVEWSTHGDMDGNWTYINSYTVPDVVNWSNTLMHQLPGQKAVDFLLPTELLGKEKVFIRLIVAKNAASNGQSYADSPISTGLIGNVLGYLSIRYNK